MRFPYTVMHCVLSVVSLIISYCDISVRRRPTVLPGDTSILRWGDLLAPILSISANSRRGAMPRMRLLCWFLTR